MTLPKRDIESALTDLLASRHSNDVFVPQCKTGPSMAHGARVLILDAWAMKKSWSKPSTYGYEIKASRSDFLNDDKWKQYLEYCSQFYFVAPPGLIEPAELPKEVGLLVASTNIKRLYCKRKAVEREVQIPETLWRYILMWRTEIREDWSDQAGQREYWERWLRERTWSRELGHRVSSELRKLYRENVQHAELENRRLRERIHRLEIIESLCRDLGIDPFGWNARREMERRMEEIQGAVPEALVRKLRAAEDGLAALRSELLEVTE